MAKLARRKKTFEKDGAQFVISPLTFGQLEEYAATSKAINEKFKDKDPNAKPGTDKAYTADELKEYQNLRFWVICAALNNAAANGEAITENDIREQMDDGTAQPLWEDIIQFSGLTIPKLAPSTPSTAGESQAGS